MSYCEFEREVKMKVGKEFKTKKMCVLLLILVLLMSTLTGCFTQRESDKVSQNLSLEADNFNIVRQLTVINCIEGDVLFQMTGKMSITADTADNQLEVTIEDEYGEYQKHFIGLSDNVTYVVEQKNFKDVNKYKYTLNYNPNMWIPITVDTVD